MFTLDLKQMYNDVKYYKVEAPKNVRTASARVLNTLAFQTKRHAPKELAASMNIRAVNFAKTSIRFTKTHRDTPLHQQRTEAGSIVRKRFTGWSEQDGKKDKRSHIFTSKGRPGGKGKARQKFRFEEDVKFARPSDLAMSPSWERTFAFLHKMRRDSQYQTPFMITKNDETKSIKPGLYTLGRRKKKNIIARALLGNKQPKKNKWLERVTARVLRIYPPEANFHKWLKTR